MTDESFSYWVMVGSRPYFLLRYINVQKESTCRSGSVPAQARTAPETSPSAIAVVVCPQPDNSLAKKPCLPLSLVFVFCNTKATTAEKEIRFIFINQTSPARTSQTQRLLESIIFCPDEQQNQFLCKSETAAR